MYPSCCICTEGESGTIETAHEVTSVHVQDLLAASETAKQGESQQRLDLQRVLQERAALESKVEILENRAKEAAEGMDQVGGLVDSNIMLMKETKQEATKYTVLIRLQCCISRLPVVPRPSSLFS
jgi:hypothetical protein